MPGVAYCASPVTREEPNQSGGQSCPFSGPPMTNVRHFSSLMQIAVTGLFSVIDG